MQTNQVHRTMLLLLGLFLSTLSFGQRLTETRALKDFQAIKLEGRVSLYLEQGEENEALIECSRSLMSMVETKVKNNTLNIGVTGGIRVQGARNIKVYLKLKDLQSIEMSGVGNIYTQRPLTLNSLEIEKTGVGSISLQINCPELHVQSKGLGSVELMGKGDLFTVSQKGAGLVKAKNFEARDVEVTNNGSGSVNVYASESINITAKGFGRVGFAGQPKEKEIDARGLEFIKALD